MSENDFNLPHKDAEAAIQYLRDDIDHTGKEIESTDRFAGRCIQAAEESRGDLKRARICLSSIRIKALLATAAPTPAIPPAPAPAPVTAPDANPAPPAPAGPPSGVPAGNAPTAPAAAPNPPPIRDDVAGGIQIRGGSQRIAVGQSARFIATDIGNRPYTSVIWNSYDEEILAIGPDGTATGRQPGRVTIQVKLADGSGTLATYELEVVIPDTPGTPPKPAPGTQPPTGSAPPGTAASGTAPTADAGGGFGDRGLQVGGGQPAQIPEPDGGFGDRGLEITTKPASSGRSQSSGADQPPPGPNPNPPGRGASGSAAGAGAAAIRPLNWQGGPQPAAWHIFATGSRMGWAAAYGRYTDGPADQDIIDHLLMAGEHAMWANRQSYPPHPAWPEWQQIRSRCREWAGDVLQCPRGEYREQVSLAVASYADSLAERVTFQEMGDRIQTPNCDGAYMRLGYNLAYGQTSLQLAAGAQQAGQTRIADRARQDAVTHLRRAVQVLLQYDQTTVVSGRCADLRDVRTEIESLLNLNDPDARIRMVRHAWETASERIRALSNLAAPTQSPTGNQASIPTNTPAGPQAGGTGTTGTPEEVNGELAGTWISVTNTWLGQGRNYLQKNPEYRSAILRRIPVSQIPGYEDYFLPFVRNLADEILREPPGRKHHRIIFSRQGDRYTGFLAPDSLLTFLSDPFFGGHNVYYDAGTAIFRLTRKGPSTYEGEILDTNDTIFKPDLVWRPTKITVKGDLMDQTGVLYNSPREDIYYWVREPAD
jgi:hypothetical protein